MHHLSKLHNCYFEEIGCPILHYVLFSGASKLGRVCAISGCHSMHGLSAIVAEGGGAEYGCGAVKTAQTESRREASRTRTEDEGVVEFRGCHCREGIERTYEVKGSLQRSSKIKITFDAKGTEIYITSSPDGV